MWYGQYRVVSEHSHVGARGGEAQLAEVALEDAVHVHRLLALALRLLHVQLRLLRHVQRHVLPPSAGPARRSRACRLSL